MHSDPNQQQLEQATAHTADPEVPLDPDVAQLRETWLAFGQLLEACESEVPMPLVERAAPAERKPKHLWPSQVWIIAGSLAACLVIVAVGWMALRAPDAADSNLAHAVPKGASDRHQPTVDSQLPQDASPDELTLQSVAWDDSFDERLDDAWRCVEEIQGHQPMVDTWQSAAQSWMQQLQQELNDEDIL